MKYIISALCIGCVFFNLGKAQANTVCQRIFNQLIHRQKDQSETARKKSADSVFEKSDLKEKGYRAIYTQGLDHALFLIQLGKKLKTKTPDEHIEDFSISIKEHIDFIRKSLLSKKRKTFKREWNTRLKILKELEQRIDEKIKNKQMTYNRYLKINYKLSLLASDKCCYHPVEIQSLDHLEGLFFKIAFSYYEKALSRFPDKIFLPTINQIGIIGFNRSFGENIHFVGLIGDKTYMDGAEMTPQQFFQHDIEHGNDLLMFYFPSQSLAVAQYKQSQFYSQFINHLESLPPKKREMAEIIYFMIAHEDLLINSSTDRLHNKIHGKYLKLEIERRIRRFTVENDLAFFLPKKIKNSRDQISAYLNESVDVFMEIFKNTINQSPLFSNFFYF